MTALGMIAAVAIVCAAPLLSEVMQTAGLRSVLSETAQSSDVSMNVSVQYLSSHVVGSIFEAIDTPIRRHLGAYLQPSQQFEIQTPKLTFNQPPLDRLGGAATQDRDDALVPTIRADGKLSFECRAVNSGRPGRAQRASFALADPSGNTGQSISPRSDDSALLTPAGRVVCQRRVYRLW